MCSKKTFQSPGFAPSLDRVVSPIKPPFQPEPKPLASSLTSLPEMAGSFVAGSVLGKSGLRGQGSLADVHVRVLRIKPGAPLIRNLDHIDVVHERILSLFDALPAWVCWVRRLRPPSSPR